MATFQETYQTESGVLLPRPQSTTGFWSWVTTVDHKRSASCTPSQRSSSSSSAASRPVDACPALWPRSQDPRRRPFNQLFTMHGTTMVFLAVMPLERGLLQLPRTAHDRRARCRVSALNAFSYWMFLSGGIFINTSWFLRRRPRQRLVRLRHLTSIQYYPGTRVDFWMLGPPDSRRRLAGVGLQLHRDDPQHARARA